MTARDPSTRNLWIIAALVLLAAAALAWFLNSPAGTTGGDIVDVSVEAPPGSDRERRGETELAEAVPDGLAPSLAGSAAGGN